MVGQGWQNDIENVQIKIVLPEAVDIDEIKAFGHGALTGNVDILNEREIVYTLKGYYAGDFVKKPNILFPKKFSS